MELLSTRLQSLDHELKQVANRFYRLEINSGVQEMNQVVAFVEEFVGEVSMLQERSVESVQELNQLLQLVMSCLQNKDYILVADLLGHELTVKLNNMISSEDHG